MKLLFTRIWLMGFAGYAWCILTLNACMAPYMWLMDKLGRPDITNTIIRNRTQVLFTRLFRLLGARIEIEGLEHVPQSGPLVVMANHQGILDIPALMLHILPRPVAFVAKQELLRVPAIAFWMRRLGCLPLNREDGKQAHKGLQKLGKKMVETNGCVAIFPEGTRTRRPGRQLGPFKRGAIRFASENSIPILPFTLDGTRLLTDARYMAATPRGQRLLRIKIEPVIQTHPMNQQQTADFMDGLQKRFEANWQALKVDWGQPPAPKEG